MTYYSTNSTNYITANNRQLAESKRLLSTLLEELSAIGKGSDVAEINKRYAIWERHLRSYKAGLFSIRSIRSLYQKYYLTRGVTETAFAKEIFTQLTTGKLVLVTEAQIGKLKGGKRYAL